MIVTTDVDEFNEHLGILHERAVQTIHRDLHLDHHPDALAYLAARLHMDRLLA